MNSHLKKSIGILLFILPFLTAGQNVNEKVTVVGTYEPTIPESNKIAVTPPQAGPEGELPVMTYQVLPDYLRVGVSPEEIVAVRLMSEKLADLHKNYLRGGLGSYMSPYLELWTNSLYSKKYSLSTHEKHLYSFGDVDGYPKTDFNQNQFNIYGSYFLINHTLNGTGGYKRDVVRHYGLGDSLKNQLTTLDLPENKQRFNRYYLSADIKSLYRGNDRFNHSGGFGFTWYRDLFTARENIFRAKAGVDKRFNLLSFTDEQQLGLNLEFMSGKTSDSTQNATFTHFSLKPFIATAYEIYKLRAGLNISITNDDGTNFSNLHPFAEAGITIVENVLSATAGITGGLERQGMEALSNINPYMQSVQDLRFTNEVMSVYGKVDARIGNFLDLGVHMKTGSYDNVPLFVNDVANFPYNRFRVIYDDGSMFHMMGSALFRYKDAMKLKFWTELENWSMKEQAYAWHKPEATFGSEVEYNWRNIVNGRFGGIVRGNQYAGIYNHETEKYEAKQLNGFTDLYLAAEYRYSNALSFWLNLNNLLSTRYQIWNDYPTQKFNGMLGVSFGF